MVANIMLALHCKKTEAVDLKGPIWEYISNTYSVEQVCAQRPPCAHHSCCILLPFSICSVSAGLHVLRPGLPLGHCTDCPGAQHTGFMLKRQQQDRS